MSIKLVKKLKNKIKNYLVFSVERKLCQHRKKKFQKIEI